MEEEVVKFEGRLLLEGPFLEHVVAALLLKEGRDVVPSLNTGGILHDVLIEDHDGYIFFECTGQREIRDDKIDKFYKDVLDLDDTLKRLKGKGVKEAVFVACTTEEAWHSSAKEALASVDNSLRRRLNVKLVTISGYELIRKLVKSGILGLRFVKGRLHFAGPEDYAIRWNQNEKQFLFSVAQIDIVKFRCLPHSFTPSYYWESYYKDLYYEYYKEEKKEPLTIWSYYYEEGVKWRCAKDIVNTYDTYLNTFDRVFVVEKKNEYLIEEWTSRRRNRYYRIHMFTANDVVDHTITNSLIGKAVRIIDELKSKRNYLEEEPFSVYVHSATEDWSFGAWDELHRGIPDTLRKDISSIACERGNELLIKLLNSGILGLHIVNNNEITLVGPGEDAVRVGWIDSGRDIVVSKRPYRL
jgi:hypothetical protein